MIRAIIVAVLLVGLSAAANAWLIQGSRTVTPPPPAAPTRGFINLSNTFIVVG